MKVLVVVHGFPPAGTGGAEIYAQAHARALAERGDRVLVFTRVNEPTRPEYEVSTEQRDGLPIVAVNNTFRRTQSFEDSYRNEAIGAIADRVIDDFRPEVAHIHHLTFLSTTIVRSLAARDIPCFMTLHDYWLMCHRGQLLDRHNAVCRGPDVCHDCLGPEAGARPAALYGASAVRAIERRLPGRPARLLNQAARSLAPAVAGAERTAEEMRRRLDHMRGVMASVTTFIAPSQDIRDRFVAFGVPADRIVVSGYGFETMPLDRLNRQPAKHLRLGFLGSLMVSKAPHLLLEAFQQLPSGTASVDLFGGIADYHGDASYRTRLAPLLEHPGVRLNGAIAHARIAEAFSAIDVLVVPSVWPETSPLVIQEAFAAGVPVVASRIGGIPELVKDEQTGLLFSPGDAQDLARALTRLLQEPGLLDRLRSGLGAVRAIRDDAVSTRLLYRRLADASTRARQRRRLAAVVLNYKAPDDTLLAVRALLASSRPLDRIMVVDNDPDGGLAERLGDVLSRVQYIPAARNLGFSGGMNIGIRRALEDGAGAILLVNSDTIVPPDCVRKLEDSLAGAGIAGPTVFSRSRPDQIESVGISYDGRTGRMKMRRTSGPIDAISACLMLVTREVFDTIGLFDEDYFFGFEDLDFCLRARRAGFRTVLAPGAAAYHEGSRSIGADNPRRLYFAARNHLLMARRTEPEGGSWPSLCRAGSIVALNLAHAVRARGGSLPARLGAVVVGTRDYVLGRFGDGAQR